MIKLAQRLLKFRPRPRRVGVDDGVEARLDERLPGAGDVISDALKVGERCPRLRRLAVSTVSADVGTADLTDTPVEPLHRLALVEGDVFHNQRVAEGETRMKGEGT